MGWRANNRLGSGCGLERKLVKQTHKLEQPLQPPPALRVLAACQKWNHCIHNPANDTFNKPGRSNIQGPRAVLATLSKALGKHLAPGGQDSQKTSKDRVQLADEYQTTHSLSSMHAPMASTSNHSSEWVLHGCPNTCSAAVHRMQQMTTTC